MRCAIWNFWNLKLFNLSQELLIWNFQMRLEMRYAIWNFLKLETFNPSQELLIWNFQMRLETRCAIWNFLSFSTYHRGCLFQTFRWDLKGDMLFETWNCLTMSLELLIWNFQMRLTKRCDTQNLWNFLTLETFQTFQTHRRGCFFETFRWDLKWDVLFETFWNFWNLKLWCVL